MQSCRIRPALATTNIANNIFSVRLSTEPTAREGVTIKTFEDIPGVPTLPVLGPLHNFLPYIGSFGSAKSISDMVKALHEKFGPIVRMPAFLSQPNTVFTCDPHDFEQVLRRETTMPIRPGFEALGHFRKNVNKSSYGGSTGLLTEHGEPWKKFRSTVNPVFLHSKTIKLYTAAIDEVSLDMVKRQDITVLSRLKKIRKSDNTIGEDIEVELNKWALESIAVVGLGGRIGCLEDDLSDESPARQLIQVVRDSFELTDALDFKPSLWRYISTPTYRKAMRTFDKQLKLGEIFIKRAITDLKKRETIDQHAEDKSILEKLLDIDDQVALIMASDMLFAGVDTAAHTMLSLLYHLGKNPEKQDKLREEIRAGDETRYLKACTRENLRLSPVVGLNVRRTTKEIILQNYLIPKGIDIVMSHEYISREESQYLRAKEFIPERWLVAKDDPLHYSSAHPMATMPFGHGVRSCIGRRIAELEVETFLARFIENFEVQWDGPPPIYVTKGLNYMLPPYHFTFKDPK